MPSLIDDDTEDEYECMLQLENEDEPESDEDDDESDGYGSSSKVYSSKIADTFDDSDSKSKKRKLEDTDHVEMNRISGLIKFEEVIFKSQQKLLIEASTELQVKQELQILKRKKNSYQN